MSSHARTTREEDRRLSIRTLIIASVASATAAIVTSLFWVGGTPIAAALTPVIVALVSELLHRPTERIAERLTTETAALPRETDVLPEAAGAGPPPPREEYEPRLAREEPYGVRAEEPEFRVYRSAPARSSRDIPWRAILVTAAAAFLIAAAALTLPELIAGQSVGGGDRNFTLFGGEPEGEKTPAEETDTQRETQPDDQATEPQETVPQLEPTPEQTDTQPQPQPETETQTTPEPQTETAPAP